MVLAGSSLTYTYNGIIHTYFVSFTQFKKLIKIIFKQHKSLILGYRPVLIAIFKLVCIGGLVLFRIVNFGNLIVPS